MKEQMQLQVTGLKKNYGNEEILDDISLSVHAGEVVVVLGPSGCGKSTLLRCLDGLEPINGGTVSLDGETVTSKAADQVRMHQKIGMVFQSYDLFPHLSILDNITAAPIHVQHRDRKEAETEAKQLLERVGLSDKLNAYPRQLSGGQKQRVAIVRALCMHPEIMLFDEVTAALDPEMVREVLDVMLELADQGMTMIIVTHEMQFARAIADRVLLMDHGRFIEEEPPEQFFTNPKTERAKEFLKTFTFEKRSSAEQSSAVI